MGAQAADRACCREHAETLHLKPWPEARDDVEKSPSPANPDRGRGRGTQGNRWPVSDHAPLTAPGDRANQDEKLVAMGHQRGVRVQAL